MSAHRKLTIAALLVVAACGGDPTAEPEPPPDSRPESLAALGLFEDEVEQTPADGVLPYDVNAVLYADEAEKLRFAFVPEGVAAGYDPSGSWDYPDGTIFVKTFFFFVDARDPALGRRMLETRIIERDNAKWTGRTYVWNEAQTEARRLKVGRDLEVEWIDAAGEPRVQQYRVPNDNECKTCHSKNHIFEPLGPVTRQLNRDYSYDNGRKNQIDRWLQQGWIDGDPQTAADRVTLAEPYGDAPLEQRARAYLDANCSHCHRPGGEAGSTSLDLRAENTDRWNLGFCRSPVAAGPGSGGRRYDIVPGNADASIMVYRMASTDPKVKMPELPTLTSDLAGTDLVRAWIDSLPEDPGCD